MDCNEIKWNSGAWNHKQIKNWWTWIFSCTKVQRIDKYSQCRWNWIYKIMQLRKSQLRKRSESEASKRLEWIKCNAASAFWSLVAAESDKSRATAQCVGSSRHCSLSVRHRSTDRKHSTSNNKETRWLCEQQRFTLRTCVSTTCTRLRVWFREPLLWLAIVLRTMHRCAVQCMGCLRSTLQCKHPLAAYAYNNYTALIFSMHVSECMHTSVRVSR